MAVLPGVLGCRPLRRTVQRYASEPTPCGCQVARPSSSRSLRSAQSRKRVPSCVVSRRQLQLPAASCRESSKCKEEVPFYCSSLAKPAASYGECARSSIFMKCPG
ncbi:MAG: hypothetical protein WBF55_18655 [Syntrophobacteria bacterium]|nr:hypothetical protein [Deltaproteobacteria bacterium]MDH3896513.1 hypothetical protein [Deltaproteobacteria bacterium]MDH3951376.1 hypothetical protein [Deltaproteobacteria bacterium]